ncbi:MAG: hypothetical protein K1000chlam1_00543, partial [Candidatus Anoxychlamydiales bacterium]|nr:hypothetical protein [Candidatus Anoxychlamydiales bacterium]
TIERRYTGSWGDIGSGGRGLTGKGTQEDFRADRTIEKRQTGTWGDMGDGRYGLTGDGHSRIP